MKNKRWKREAKRIKGYCTKRESCYSFNGGRCKYSVLCRKECPKFVSLLGIRELEEVLKDGK